jgi:hypothetical protein
MIVPSTKGATMARQEIVKFVSDLSGDEEAETVSFALDGADYEIDLTKKEQTAFQRALAKYVESGRKTATRGRGVRRTTVRPAGPSTKAIREWARSQGFSVPDKGRVPNEIMAKFEAAHPS